MYIECLLFTYILYTYCCCFVQAMIHMQTKIREINKMNEKSGKMIKAL